MKFRLYVLFVVSSMTVPVDAWARDPLALAECQAIMKRYANDRMDDCNRAYMGCAVPFVCLAKFYSCMEATRENLKENLKYCGELYGSGRAPAAPKGTADSITQRTQQIEAAAWSHFVESLQQQCAGVDFGEIEQTAPVMGEVDSAAADAEIRESVRRLGRRRKARPSEK